jgi:N-methylhydantoinase B
VRSATWYGVRLLAQDDVPVNHGCFQPVTVITPPHSLLNPDFPAAVAVGNTETGQRIVDVVLGALGQALPGRIPAASQGTMNNFTFGGNLIPQPFLQHGAGERRAFVYYETLAGGHGAGPLGDGLGGRHSHMTNTRNTPVEALEYALPVRVLEYGLRDGSGGPGEHRGGDGIRRVYEFLAPATITLNSERRVYAPYGLGGGQPGQPGINRLIHNHVETLVSGKYTGAVQAGDRVVIETPGGGGWGINTSPYAVDLFSPAPADHDDPADQSAGGVQDADP